jgi:hypothetical protein
MRMRALVASGLVLLGLSGCSDALPPVSIASVTPTGMVASEPTAVNVQVDAQLAFQVDYGQGSLTADTGLEVFVGPLQLGTGNYPMNGLVQGVLPTVIPPGTYNVSVKMGDGRTAVLANAFAVDAGTWPAAYVIDTIGDQRSGVAFSVILRAVGQDAARFHGNVLLGLLGDGSVDPTISGAFSSGVRVENVTVTGTGEFTLLASDVNGGNGQSAPFTVSP